MNIKWKISLFLLLFSILCMQEGKSQEVAIKTNILYDAAATVNLGVEFGMHPRWTMDISGNYNGWIMPQERRWKHWMAQPEARYWFCEKFGGHFLGIHAHGGMYNFGNLGNNLNVLGTNYSLLSNERFQGWFVGAGVGYGYAWILGKHWNFEAEIGIGYSYTRYDRFPCAECGDIIEHNVPHHVFGLTKLALNFVYVF